MRRIARRKEPPPFLLSDAVAMEKEHLLSYLRRDPDDRRSRRDTLDDSLFFDRSFRRDLNKVFHGTCAFCESRFSADDEEDEDNLRVGHFRPLRFVKDSSELDKDYYLWLAFEWHNIHAVCSYCDKAKRNRFPVKGKRADFLASYASTNQQERRLLLDPCQDDPSKHLAYRFNGAVHPVTAKGHATITVFDLNRKQLIVRRRRVIDRMLRSITDDWIADTPPWVFVHPGSVHSGALTQLWRRLAVELDLVPERVIRAAASRFPQELQSFLERLTDRERRNLIKGTDLLRDNDRNQPTQVIPVEWDEAELDPHVGDARPSLFFGSDQEIRSILVTDFKVIDRVKLSLPPSRAERSGAPCMMILGENSTGKSSILSAIALALIGVKESRKLAKFVPAAVRSTDRRRLDQHDQMPMGSRISFHNTRRAARFVYDPRIDEISGSDQASIVLGYGPRRFFDPKKRNYSGGAASRVRTLFDPLATIPYPDEWLSSRTNSQFETIAAALRVVLAMEEDDELIREGQTILVRANGRSTSIEALSEGYRSVFTMTVDMLREFSRYWRNVEEAQGVVLIDEIETHLHPRWKMQVMTSLRRVLPKVQFIATTHDPLCLRGMDDGEVVVLQRDSDFRIGQLEDLPSIRGMTAEQLLTSDYFGLASTADPGLELGLMNAANDFAQMGPTGRIDAKVSERTKSMLHRLTLGSTPSEQVMQEALERYLAQREAPDGRSRTQLRAEAVEQIVAALKRVP